MRARRLLTVLALSATVIAGVVVLLWSIGSSAVAREPFSTVSVTPAEVDLYIALNTEPSSEQWIAFADLLDTLNVQDPFRDAWTDALDDVDIDWERDIVALLGDEAYVAITDFGKLDEYEGAVAVFQLRSTSRAEEFFVDRIDEALDDNGEDEREETTYEGVKIHLLPYDVDDFGFSSADYEYDEDTEEFSEPGEGEARFAAAAFTQDLAIFGLSQADVEGIIDVLQGRAPSAEANARFMEQRIKRTDDFLLWGYVDMEPAWDALEEFIDEEALDEDGDPKLQEQFQRLIDESRASNDRITFSITAQSDGLVIDATSLHKPGASPQEGYLGIPFETKFADAVPSDTLVFAAGYDLYNQIYRPLYDSLADIDLNFADPYCSSTGSFGAPFFGPGLDEGYEDDPIYGQFYDDDGGFDYDAYELWQEELDRRFTLPDGGFDYDAYSEYFESINEAECEERSQTIAEAIAEFEQDVGFDLEDDFLGLMTGEIAFALEASNFDADEPEFAFAALAEVTNVLRAGESMRLIEDYLVREEQLGLRSTADNGIRQLEDAEGDESFSWIADDGRLIVGYPYDYVSMIHTGGEGASLADSDDWKRTLELLPGPKTGVLYVNMSRLLEEVRNIEDAENDLADATDGEVTFEDLKPIRSIGLVTQNVDGGVSMRAIIVVNE